jgi:hypothetical protein
MPTQKEGYMPQKTKGNQKLQSLKRAVQKRRVTVDTLRLAREVKDQMAGSPDLVRALAAWNPRSLPKTQADWAMLDLLVKEL